MYICTERMLIYALLFNYKLIFMQQITILNSYIIPFIIVFVGMFLNEYRLYKIDKLEYKSFVNSIAMLIMSLLSFILCQIVVMGKW